MYDIIVEFNTYFFMCICNSVIELELIQVWIIARMKGDMD